MGFLFPKSRTPPPTSPAARPVSLNIETLQKDRDRRRSQLAKAGRAGTILTEGQSLASATLLGENQ